MFVNVFLPHIPTFAFWNGAAVSVVSFKERAGIFLQNRSQGV
jgi:type IV secretory pathway VirB3-like protein